MKQKTSFSGKAKVRLKEHRLPLLHRRFSRSVQLQIETTILRTVDAKQITFVGFALFAASLIFFSSDWASVVVPGWHVTILPGGYWNYDLLSVYFLGMTVIYGYIPKGSVKSILFIVHAVSSIAPLLVQRFVLFSYFTIGNPLNTKR